MRTILSIDGGGIRGIIPACVLVELERQTGKPCRDLFDMVAGTSTGALIAAAVVAGVPATDILRIYTDRSHEIFKQQWDEELRRIEGYAYDPLNIYKVMKSELGPAANWCLNDSPIPILLTAMGVNKHPWYFVKDRPRNKQTTGKLSLLDCATASAAAPTYFSSWYVSPLGGTLIGHCFDGGIGVTADPAYQACKEAFDYDDFCPATTRMVSIGTGYFEDVGEVNPPDGILAMISWCFDAVLNSVATQQTEIVNRCWPGLMNRLNWELPRSIDMAYLSAIPELLEVGKKAALTLDWSKILT